MNKSSASRNQIPVVDTHSVILGYATTSAYRQASALLGTSAAQNFRDVNGRRRLCWTASTATRWSR